MPDACCKMKVFRESLATNSEHRRHKRLNNRAENSHLPTRKRERVLQRFKSAEHAQRFLVPFSAVSNHFRPRRHLLTASPTDSSAPSFTTSGEISLWAMYAHETVLSEQPRASSHPPLPAPHSS
jgi:hypothetical protein